MKALYLRYNREKFWENYWNEFSVDHDEFLDVGMYPIDLTLKYVRKDARILECGFGGGRVIRHLAKHGYQIEGIELNPVIVEQVKQADVSLKVTEGNILDLQFENNSFDVSLCFGVLGGLESGLATGLMELKRVTRPGGLLIVSVMLKNIGRFAQKLLDLFSIYDESFYAWMDTQEGWQNIFRAFDLGFVESRPMVSRYNIYYWTKFLRPSGKTDLALARVKDSAYRLNPLGKIMWFLHKKLLQKELAGAVNFVLRNQKDEEKP